MTRAEISRATELARTSIASQFEDLLLDAVVDPPSDSAAQCSFSPGPAGSGKTIALKRSAWEASISLGALALWLRDGGALSDDIISELHRLTGKRISSSSTGIALM